MASIINLKVRHNTTVRTIALYNGLSSEELSTILQAIFSLSASAVVIGLFSAENGLVIPISLACKAPEALSAAVEYSLLVSGDSINELPAPPPRVKGLKNGKLSLLQEMITITSIA
jgi:hypothetical protein